MQITRQADYALRAAKYLAGLAPNQKTSTAEIARIMQIPPSFLAKILSQLALTGIIYSERGAHGGVALARPAAELSVLEVLEAIDGSITMSECTVNEHFCPFTPDCSLHKMWCGARDELVNKLRNITLAQVA